MNSCTNSNPRRETEDSQAEIAIAISDNFKGNLTNNFAAKLLGKKKKTQPKRKNFTSEAMVPRGHSELWKTGNLKMPKVDMEKVYP